MGSLTVEEWTEEEGGNPDRFNETYHVVPGTAFPFLAGLYPETTRSNGDEKPAGLPDEIARASRTPIVLWTG